MKIKYIKKKLFDCEFGLHITNSVYIVYHGTLNDLQLCNQYEAR